MEIRKDLVTGQHVYAPEYHILIEAVKGCNRSCAFCGCETKPVELMKRETFDAILRNVTNKTKKITWNLGGESTLHPGLVQMVKEARKIAPKAVFDLITNGDVRILKKRAFGYVESLFEAGINQIHLDIYDDDDVPVFENMVDTLTRSFECISFDSAKSAFWGMTSKRTLVYMPATFNINRPKKCTVAFNTQGGATPVAIWKENGVDASMFPLNKTCAECLRYISVRFDGAYTICCADHGRPTDYGNVNHMTFTEYWESPMHRMAAMALSRGRRDLVPSCYLCNRLSFRDGLTPYPYVDEFSVKAIREELFRKSVLRGKLLNNYKEVINSNPKTHHKEVHALIERSIQK